MITNDYSEIQTLGTYSAQSERICYFIAKITWFTVFTSSSAKSSVEVWGCISEE
jgi:hypothetical protein